MKFDKDDLIIATSRAARMVAGLASAQHGDDYLRPLREARAEGRVVELAMALALRCADIALDAYGDERCARLDQFALDSLTYQQRQRGSH